MLEDPSDALIRQTGDRSTALERALLALAQAYADQDSSQRLFMDQSQKTVSRYAEQFRGDQPVFSNVLSSWGALTDRPAESAVRSKAQSDGAIVRAINAALHAQQQLGTFGQAVAEPDPDIDVTVPAESTLDLFRMTAIPAGVVDDPGRSGPNRCPETASGNVEFDVRPDDIHGRNVTAKVFARLAPEVRASVLGQLATVTPVHTRLEPEAELAQALADTLTWRETLGPTDLGANNGLFPFDHSHDRGVHHGFPSAEVDSHAAEAQTIVRSDLALRGTVGSSKAGAVIGGLTGVFSQGSQVFKSTALRATADADGGWNGNDGRLAVTMTSNSAHEATAATAAEVERLRIAVRRTIDDLERVRGSVQPALPALPRNSGAFRIS